MSQEKNGMHPVQEGLMRCVNEVARWRQQKVFGVGRRPGGVVSQISQISWNILSWERATRIIQPNS